jgi:hypothetical protein
MKMIGDQQEAKAGLLRQLRVRNQFIRLVFLAG